MTPYLVLDLETRETFREVGAFSPALLSISLVGIYDSATDRESTFRAEELDALGARLRTAPLVVGYNLHGFDYPVLKAALAKMPGDAANRRLDPFTLPTVDLFLHLQQALGFRPKLDAVAEATLGHGKTGDGLDAIRFFRQGNWDALAQYCLNDVRITRDLYEHGLRRGHVKFPLRNGTVAEVKATWVPAPEQVKLC